jgi:hypothetical protein
MVINYKGSQGQTKRALVLQEEEEEEHEKPSFTPIRKDEISCSWFLFNLACVLDSLNKSLSACGK